MQYLQRKKRAMESNYTLTTQDSAIIQHAIDSEGIGFFLFIGFCVFLTIYFLRSHFKNMDNAFGHDRGIFIAMSRGIAYGGCVTTAFIIAVIIGFIYIFISPILSLF